MKYHMIIGVVNDESRIDECPNPRRALEEVGVEFIDENGGGGAGVRLRKPGGKSSNRI